MCCTFDVALSISRLRKYLIMGLMCGSLAMDLYLSAGCSVYSQQNASREPNVGKPQTPQAHVHKKALTHIAPYTEEGSRS